MKRKQKGKYLGFISLTLSLIILDQLTKYFALQNLVPYQPLHIVTGLQFTLSFNTGVAFSLLDNYGELGRWLLASFSIIMSIFFIVLLKQEIKISNFKSFAFSLILAGAIGNVLDRIFLGYVIDFIDVYYKNYHWPAFNIADSSICIGLFLWVLAMLRKR